LATTEIAAAALENDWLAGLRRFLPKLCIAVTISVLLLGLGEVGAYIYLRLTPQLPYTGLHLPPEQLGELQESAKHQYLPYVLYRRRPFQGRFISVDQQGVRKTVDSHCDDPRSFQIWMFGDSALWGSGVADRDTIPSKVARLYSASGQSVCVKNFAEQAWVSTQEVVSLLLQLKHSDHPPALVVFYDGTNEIFLPDRNAPNDIDQNYYRFRELVENAQRETEPGLFYLSKTNTVRALQQLSGQMYRRFKKPSPISEDQAQTAAQAIVDNYHKNMEMVDELARAYGFQAFYCWYPTSSFGKKVLTAEERNSLRQETEEVPAKFQIKQATYDLLSRLHRPNFFFLGDELDDQRGWVYLDGSHLRAGGNQIIAEKLFQVLRTTRASVLP